MMYWSQWSRAELDAMHDVVEDEVEEIELEREEEECLLKIDLSEIL